MDALLAWVGEPERLWAFRIGHSVGTRIPGEVRPAPHGLGHSALARANRFLGEVWVNERG
jgi:hypothetical protein